MKTKIYHLLVCIAGLLCLYACDDEKNNSEVVMLPRIMTVAPTDIKATSVLAGGHVMSDGGGNITERESAGLQLKARQLIMTRNFVEQEKGHSNMLSQGWFLVKPITYVPLSLMRKAWFMVKNIP